MTPDSFRSLSGPLMLDVEIDGAITPIELTVQSVDPLPAHRFNAAPFSLMLAGPLSPLLRQATYALRHPQLGNIQLFLVPVGQDAQCTRYEVTFN